MPYDELLRDFHDAMSESGGRLRLVDYDDPANLL